METAVTVEVKINVPCEVTWKFFISPEHIAKWYFASSDWHVPVVENDFRLNGKFKISMQAKDGGAGFDFEGVYTHIQEHKLIEYTISDGRKVKVIFSGQALVTKITEVFEAENQNPVEKQKERWQAILNNFKEYAESNYKPVKTVDS